MSTASVRSHRDDGTPAVELAYDRRGSGPPLVLIHPLGGDRRVWDPVIEALVPVRTVIAVDLPGFGDSPRLTETPTPSVLARTVARFLAEIGLERPHVAGNSLGGWVALELARAGRVRSVTAIAPAGLWAAPLVPKPSVARILAGALRPILPVLTATAAGRRTLLGGVMVRPDRVPATAAAHIVLAYATAPAFIATNDAMRAGRFDELGQIEVPVTLAWPDHDRLIARPARLPPQVRNRVLVGCGHLPMWDAPDQVAQVLLDGSVDSASMPVPAADLAAPKPPP
ncbi:MAG TPA: alpha/beta fold hydrolase [Solirubrobacteraceae bacterium]|jgi:pimeloyl-ACP methyl ester carboxylesterase|nr:alpha/beta fold hydrolase [Solirubrobacteraceae bacterium]